MSTAYDLGVSPETRLTAESADRLDRLFRLHNARLLGFAVTRTRDYATAEDVVSETWVRAALSIHQLQADNERAYGWLRSITVRAAIDHYRLRRSSEAPTDFGDVLIAVRLVPATPPADIDLYALAELTAPQATAVKLAAQGLSHQRIADRLGKSRQAVQQNIHRGARRLRSLPLAG
ncbi:RNA polymerase sigma factor [Streptomyces antarcticus]|uniref:RNA polymerase sigma factor n=2 Tax=Streptomyces antarcticus TaxID=2996458 RepID=UPI0022708FB6|nr:sigma-70 family RNA polymerase sigma factor [Streptomyces sp. H34-AA3]MCY0947739.1 sigma-70 family RNA polymerase sigma factor [Streptomyces sp. H34-AA3]